MSRPPPRSWSLPENIAFCLSGRCSRWELSAPRDSARQLIARPLVAWPIAWVHSARTPPQQRSRCATGQMKGHRWPRPTPAPSYSRWPKRRPFRQPPPQWQSASSVMHAASSAPAPPPRRATSRGGGCHLCSTPRRLLRARALVAMLSRVDWAILRRGLGRHCARRPSLHASGSSLCLLSYALNSPSASSSPSAGRLRRSPS